MKTLCRACGEPGEVEQLETARGGALVTVSVGGETAYLVRCKKCLSVVCVTLDELKSYKLEVSSASIDPADDDES